MRTSKLSSLAIFSFVFSALTAQAQAQTAPAGPSAPAPATAPPAAAAPAATPAPAAEPAPATEPAPAAAAPEIPPPCFPACRDGFLCGPDAQCISACNPACAAGERCTGQGQCVIEATVAPVAPPPPAYPPSTEWVPAPEPGAETHDGIMLRFTIGLGGGGMSEELDNGGGDNQYSGGGLFWAVDIGAGLTDTLTVQARLAQTQFFGPQRKIDGEEMELDEGRNLSATLFGAGLTYHFMPINLYVTAIGGLSDLRITDGQNPELYDEDKGKVGFGMNLDVGKEWWVVPQTGIGVAGRFMWATGGTENALGRRDVDADRNLLAFGVLFSVTHQ